jgi:C4-dicarboxylate-specific signal transduction histidine kinase
MDKKDAKPQQNSSPEREHLDLFVHASELLSSSPEIKDILDRLMEQVIEVIRARRGFIIMREDIEGEWQFITARDIDMGTIKADDFQISRSVVERVASEGRSIVTSDALHDSRLRGKTSVSLYDLKSIICVPLIIHGRTLGVIYADHQIETCVFGKREKTLLESIARQAAIAIENARLYEKMKRIHEESMEKARKELRDTQAQLFQSSKMAAVGQLAAGIAHEINNPLGAIELTASSMRRQTTDERFLKRIEVIENATNQCKKIVGSLLRFSHPARDVNEKMDVGRMLQNTLSLIEPQLEKENISVRHSLQESLIIRADEGELSQVVMNILMNSRDALKSRPEGQKREITVRSWSSEGSALIQIADNGEGIDEALLERIYEPFFTTKPVGQGVGLGLSISFQIVKKHNGEIGVASQKGRGTAFTLRFPVEGGATARAARFSPGTEIKP